MITRKESAPAGAITLSLPYPQVRSPYHALSAPFPTQGKKLKASEEIAALWLKKERPELSKILTNAMRYGHYSPEEAQQCYLLYLRSHYKQGSIVYDAMIKLLQDSKEQDIVLIGPEIYCKTLEYVIHKLT